MHNSKELEKNLLILSEGLKILDFPLLVTEQYTRGLGFTIPSLSYSLGQTGRLEKKAFSCCDDDGIMNEIRRINKKNVIIAGIESHVCVLQTCIDLMEQGFQPVLVEDCVSSRKPRDKEMALKRLTQEGVLISTYESVLFELARYSGTESFKSISKLIK